VWTGPKILGFKDGFVVGFRGFMVPKVSVVSWFHSLVGFIDLTVSWVSYVLFRAGFISFVVS